MNSEEAARIRGYHARLASLREYQTTWEPHLRKALTKIVTGVKASQGVVANTAFTQDMSDALDALEGTVARQSIEVSREVAHVTAEMANMLVELAGLGAASRPAGRDVPDATEDVGVAEVRKEAVSAVLELTGDARFAKAATNSPVMSAGIGAAHE